MVQLRQQLALELMREADVGTVQEIEREIFSTPWPRNAYYRELASRSSAHYLVLRQEGPVERPAVIQSPAFDPSIAAYAGPAPPPHPPHTTPPCPPPTSPPPPSP